MPTPADTAVAASPVLSTPEHASCRPPRLAQPWACSSAVGEEKRVSCTSMMCGPPWQVMTTSTDTVIPMCDPHWLIMMCGPRWLTKMRSLRWLTKMQDGPNRSALVRCTVSASANTAHTSTALVA